MPANTLLADTAAIRALGSAYTAQSADLAAAAQALRTIAGSDPAGLGPVGADFVAAFTAAVSEHSDAVAALGESARAACATASHNASAYEAAGNRAAHVLPRV